MMKHAIVVLAIVGAFLAVPGQAGATPVLLNELGGQGTGLGQFSFDYGLAVQSNGDVWVADGGNNRIQIYDSSNNSWKAITTAGGLSAGGLSFSSPKGIAIAPSSGDVYVSDSGRQRVLKYSGYAADGTGGTWTQISISGSGTGAGKFASPQGLDVDALGNLWVADSNNNRIQMYNGSSWTTYSGVTNPTDVAVNPSNGNIYVAERSNNRISISNISTIAPSPSTSWAPFTTSVTYPSGVALDPLGNVWVSETGPIASPVYRLQEFSAGGVSQEIITTFTESTKEYFNFPYGLDVDGSNNIWVADTSNSRILEFGEAPPTNVIPEPVTMAGLALGLSCLTGYIRRRRTA